MGLLPKILGYAGALPFIVCAALLFLAEATHPLYQIIALCQLIYAALILSFLGGAHWLDAIRTQNQKRLVASMLPTIAGFGCAVLALFFGPLIPLAGTLVLFWIVYSLDRLYPFDAVDYAPFRFRITMIVSIFLALSCLALL